MATLVLSPRPPRTSAAPSSFRPSAAMRSARPYHAPSSSKCRSSSRPDLLATVKSPAILATLIAHLDWPDLLSLLNTCQDCRSIFRDRNLRDILLVRFVPGYAHALPLRDFNNYHDIPVSIHDITLLLISQRLPLHRYPTHALRTLTTLYPSLEEDYYTSKLVTLTGAHSRFVLLLQALVHSSSTPVPPEPEDTYRTARHPASHSPAKHARQLTFPAPLSYVQEQLHQQQQIQTPHRDHALTPSSRKQSRRSKHHSLPARSESTDPSSSHLFSQPHAARPSADSIVPITNLGTHELSKNTRRRSLFRQPAVTPPPPEEPRALRIYSSSWRKSSWTSATRHQLSLDNFASGAISDQAELKHPKRRFTSTNVSSDSSVPSSPVTSSSPLPRSRSGESSPSSSSPSTPPPTTYPSAGMLGSPLSTRMTSPHDLVLATSRVRAPVLRVFVPCTEMEVNSGSILMCEKYLVDAGLWEHLSTGDVVCNLGYIPPTSEDVVEEDSGSPTRFGYRGNNGGGNSRKWLLFNGEYLVPYTAPDLLPIENPISLPSPFYYTHIMPMPFGSESRSGNIRFLIGGFPPVTDEIPQLEMVNLAGRVRSAKSASGWMEVRKWAWTARVVRYHSQMLSSLSEKDRAVVQSSGEMGGGWYGEWVLEGEGTKEGKQMLVDILSNGVVPGGPGVWELVRDRSGEGRIWLRLVT